MIVVSNYLEGLADYLMEKEREYRHLAPRGSASFLGVLSTHVRKTLGPTNIGHFAQSIENAADGREFVATPGIEQFVEKVARWAEWANAAEAFAQMTNVILADLKDDDGSA